MLDSHAGPRPPDAGEVGACHVESVDGEIGRPHGDARALHRDRQRDDARARTEVDDRARIQVVDDLQGALDHDLGLRPRDEDPPVDMNIE